MNYFHQKDNRVEDIVKKVHYTSRRRLIYIYDLCKNKKKCESEEDGANNANLEEQQVLSI